MKPFAAEDAGPIHRRIAEIANQPTKINAISPRTAVNTLFRKDNIGSCARMGTIDLAWKSRMLTSLGSVRARCLLQKGG